MIQKIQADYDQLANITADFSNEAEMVEQLILSINRLVDVLCSGGWIGRGAARFYDEMYNVVLPGLRRLGSALQDASAATSQISQIIQEAEETASRLFAPSTFLAALGPQSPEHLEGIAGERTNIAMPSTTQQEQVHSSISEILRQKHEDAKKTLDNLR